MKFEGQELKSGTRLYLQRSRADGVTEVMPCVLSQAIDDRELIVQPLSADTYASFLAGETYTTRIVEGDKRFSLASTILFKIEHPHRQIHLSYPQASDNVFKRKASRFQIAKPVRLSLHTGEKEITVHLHDISNTGACLIADNSLARGADILNIELRDPFNQSLITLHCLVRYVLVDMVDGMIQYRHGVEFQFQNDEEQSDLEQFIDYLLQEQIAIPLST